MSLVVCSACQRHGRGPSCVFCGAELATARAFPGSASLAQLSRAALVAAAVAACDHAPPAPAYGGPPPGPPIPATAVTAPDPQTLAPAYGVPPPPPATVTTSGPPSPARDAGAAGPPRRDGGK